MNNTTLAAPNNPLKRWMACICLLPLLICVGMAQAIEPIPANYVAMFIHNDIDNNGNITVIEGQKVRVGWAVESNLDKVLGSKDKIQLLRVLDDSIVSSVSRGKGSSGKVSLRVKNAAGEALYVHYWTKSTETVINTISHPDFGSDNTPLRAITKANSTDLALRMNELETARYFAVGDTGPAGGLVFYVSDNGLHGLEAAPADLPGNPKWGCMGIVMPGADATRVGMGARNTDDIVRGCLEADTAAELADLYSLNGYNDWFLPSQDELNLMRTNIGQGNPDGNIGNFSNVFYWSATESSAGQAITLRFGDNFQQALNKDDDYHQTRPVRAFSGMPAKPISGNLEPEPL